MRCTMETNGSGIQPKVAKVHLYKPISLSSFLLKLLESILDQNIRGLFNSGNLSAML